MAELIEVLPELTSRLELIIIDDGSDDETHEIARQLVSTYPQVRLVSHAQPRGYAAAIQTGVGASTGEVLLIKENGCRLTCTELSKLWKATEEHPMVLGRPRRPVSMNRFNVREPKSEKGFRMVVRHAVIDVLASLGDHCHFAGRASQAWHEVELKSRATSSRIDSEEERFPTSTETADSAARFSPHQPREMRGPNFLGPIKDFALGE